MKPYFIKRVGAYIVDLIIISLIATVLMLPFPYSSNIQKLTEESNQIMNSYQNEEIDTNTFLSQSMEVSYDLTYAKVGYTIFEVVLLILYFTLFPFYNKGQTFGKKLLHTQIVRVDGKELTMNDLLIRALLINTIFCLFLELALVLFCSKDVFFYTSSVIEVMQGFFLIVCGFMSSIQKEGRGLHDMISHTKVINVERKEG